jgi:non-heme chloroperoxidase
VQYHNIIGGAGVRLRAVEAGNPSGRAILFIHGWSQSHLSWSRQLNSRLCDTFRLVAVDLRGHGESDKPRDAYGDSALWADDVQAVIDALSLERPILSGWSYGGLIINDYIRHHGQERLGGINYVGAATDLGIETSYNFLGAAWDSLLPGQDGSVSGTVFSDDAAEAATAMRTFLRRCFPEPLPIDEEMPMLGFNLVCPPRVRLELLSRTLQNDAVLEMIRVPVLISHGNADEVIDIQTARHIASRVRQANVSVYDGLGHAPFWEDADRFNRELAEFASAADKTRQASVSA